MRYNDLWKAYHYLVLIIILVIVGCTGQNESIYIVKQIDQSNGKVGALNTVDWSQANLLNEFISPWREGSANTTFQALWDDQYFYFKFDVLEDNILIYREHDLEEEVVGSERVEIFFRRDEELNPYYCLEMDASGRVFDYKAAHYREFVREWSWPQDQLIVEARQSEHGYTVTGKIGLQSLQELGLLKESKLQVGLFRGRCLQAGGGDSTFHWISWVHPETEQPDFHVASSFGELVLAE